MPNSEEPHTYQARVEFTFGSFYTSIHTSADGIHCLFQCTQRDTEWFIQALGGSSGLEYDNPVTLRFLWWSDKSFAAQFTAAEAATQDREYDDSHWLDQPKSNGHPQPPQGSLLDTLDIIDIHYQRGIQYV